MSREQLTVNVPEDKMGYDNPGMVKNRKISNVVNIPMTEKPAANGNGMNDGSDDKLLKKNPLESPKSRKASRNGERKTSLNGVYVVPVSEVGKEKGSKENYEPYDERHVKHPTTFLATKDVLKNVFSGPPHKSTDLKYEEYNPFEHRDIKHPTTYWETLIHMLKASLGTGILAMPSAFHNAGYLVGGIGTILIGFLCTYTIHILISSEYELCKRKKVPSMTYPATAEAAISEGPKRLRPLAKYMPILCNVFLLLYQIGSCCIYVVFVASNIKAVVDDSTSTRLDVRVYMLCLLLPLIFINYVRNLKFLAPLSTIANIVTIISFGIIFYYLFDELGPLDELPPVGQVRGMPLFFGTVLFAMEAIGVVMPLENEMKEPKKFGSTFGVLNCAMIPITLLYTLTGFLGYWRFGATVEGSITLNLPNHILAQSAKVMLAFAIFITHALACYVAIDITWREYVEPKVTNRKVLWEYVLRTILVLISFLFAALIPNLELFISLIGALCLSTMGLAFPALINLFTFWDDKKGSLFVLFFLKNIFIIFIALLGFVVGTATSLEEIIVKVF